MQHLIPPLSIVMNLIAGLVLGGYFYFLIAIYVGLAMGFFTVWPDFIKIHNAISNQFSDSHITVGVSSRVIAGGRGGPRQFDFKELFPYCYCNFPNVSYLLLRYGVEPTLTVI